MKARPGFISHVLCVVLCLLLTVMTVMTGMLSVGVAMVSLRDQHLSMAVNDERIAAQMNMIDAKLTELSELYHFDKAPVAALVTEEIVRQQNVDTVYWWTGLFGASPVFNAPTFRADAAYDIVLADEGFMESSGTHARSMARRVVKGVRNAVDQTILPVRSQLFTMVLNKVNSKIDITRLTALLPWLPAMTLSMMFVLSGALLFLCGRLICKGRLYIGCGLGSGALLTLACVIGMLVMDLPGLAGTYSSMMAMQITTPVTWVLIALTVYAVVCLAAAILLIRSHQTKMIGIRRAAAMEVPA